MQALLSFIKARKWYIIIALIVLVFLLLRTTLLEKPNTELTYTVQKENLVDTVQVSAIYTTAAQTKVISPAKGIIIELFVSNNDEVKKGDPLFHVESTATTEERAAANADYQNAVNNLKIAQQNKEAADATMWTEHTTLLDARNDQKYKNENSQNPSTKKDYTELEKQSIDAAVTQAEKDFKVAEKKYLEADSAVSAEQADLTKAQLALAATKSITVKAPAAGTIVNLQKQVGDQVVAQSSTSQALAQLGLGGTTDTTPPVLVIANLGNPALTASISEAYIPRIEVGQKAEIVFDALKDKTFNGLVESIDTVGTVMNGIVTYNARFSGQSIPLNIKPNMTALVTIETLKKENVLTVPNSAIIQRDGKNYVQKTNSKNEMFEVELGTKGIAKSEIVSGLSDGTVINSNPNQNK